MPKPSVYIFRGAPASGKGTIVPAFCKLLPTPLALIEQDKFRWGIHLFGREIRDIEDGEHRLAHRITEQVYEEYLKDGNYTIVVEGLFTWDDDTSSQGSTLHLRELALRYGFACTNILLRASRDELLRRNAGREYGVPRAEFDILFTNVYDTVGVDEIVIDSTGMDVGQTLEKLRDLTT